MINRFISKITGIPRCSHCGKCGGANCKIKHHRYCFFCFFKILPEVMQRTEYKYLPLLDVEGE